MAGFLRSGALPVCSATPAGNLKAMTRRPDGACVAENIKGVRLPSGLAEMCVVGADRHRIRCLNASVKNSEGFDNIVLAVAVDGIPASFFSVRTP